MVEINTKFKQELKAPEEELARAVKLGLQDIRDKIMEVALKTLEEDNINDEMMLSNSAFPIGGGSTPQDKEFELYCGFSAPHAEYVEYGTTDHWPPPVPIYEWCRRKLQKTGRRMEDNDESADFLLKLAFGKIKKRLSDAEKTFIGVYKKIGTRGTEAHPFFRSAIEEVKPLAEGIMEKRVKKELGV